MRKLKNEELPRLTVEEFHQAEKLPAIVILDNIRSMNNVGSAFRSSDAFLVEEIHLCGITAKPPHREIHKTALGATETVKWEYFESTMEAVEKCKRAGYKVLAIEQADNSLFLNEFTPDKGEKYAFIFGNEVFGVEDKVVESADGVLEIPQFGTKHSLNISVSIGIVLWDYQVKTLGSKINA